MSILRSVISWRGINKLLTQRTSISSILCKKLHIEPQIAKLPTKKCEDDDHDIINMEKGRPMSPFISIYATEIQGMASIHNRITGAFCTLQIACFGLAFLILPESVDFYVDKVNSWDLAPALIFACKYLNAWPWTYHTIDGTRHIIWDLTGLLTAKSVIISSWLVVFLAVVATICLSLL